MKTTVMLCRTLLIVSAMQGSASEVAEGSVSAVYHMTEKPTSGTLLCANTGPGNFKGNVLVRNEEGVVARVNLPPKEIRVLLVALANECQRLGVKPSAAPGESPGGQRDNSMELFLGDLYYFVSTPSQRLPKSLTDLMNEWIEGLKKKVNAPTASDAATYFAKVNPDVVVVKVILDEDEVGAITFLVTHARQGESSAESFVTYAKKPNGWEPTISSKR